MLEVDFTVPQGLNALDDNIKAAVVAKLTELTDRLYQKVVENLSGKILEKHSGQLAGSVRQSVDISGSTMTGTVFMDPASPKAWALEKGGAGYYPIVPTKAAMLHFVTKSGEEVFTRHVSHPPSKAFGYLKHALEDMEAEVPEGFKAAIDEVLEMWR